MRWSNDERTLLLSGDHGEATLFVRRASAFAQDEFWELDRGLLPYTWQLDRKGPGSDPGWTFNGHAAADDGESAQEQLSGMLASWAEHMPVQAPGDWVACTIWASRDRGRSMILSYAPSDTGRELHACIDDRDHEQTPERAARMRARGWRELDEHRWGGAPNCPSPTRRRLPNLPAWSSPICALAAPPARTK
ncbi:hypothetical protein ACFPFX_34020 [Streptomyces mauvecolor]|uniref:Uncharacterized protein n=1 Tax=Streptomyces mauvecolor TaxID=58345 RepID=A0ABV9UY31_9ACTN